jgi:diguanylate cyclase (GGDEF)-like protein
MPSGQTESGSTGVAKPRCVLVLNHARDPLGEVLATLQRAGYDAREAGSLAETSRLLGEARPDVVILNPLVLAPGGVELELVQALQREDDPVPVILLVEDLTTLDAAHQLELPFLDFLIRPHSAAECAQRVELALIQRRRFLDLHSKARQLEGQVSVDFKTGLMSELYFKRIVQLEWKRAQRHQNPLSLLLLDVDDFKRVNDSTEYAFGDEVLRKVGEMLKQIVRETDFAARLGGDEFSVLLPQTTPAEAVQTALRIRQRISAMTVQSGPYSRQVTVSIGLDAYDGRSPGTMEGLRQRANKALQEAKKRGKNQVWLFAEPEAGAAAQ